MAKIHVPDYIAERTLGHQLTGVQAIYNRHPYFEEKSEAVTATGGACSRSELFFSPAMRTTIIIITLAVAALLISTRAASAERR
jgi:hypothetical protein